jgi:hypothetical protein
MDGIAFIHRLVGKIDPSVDVYEQGCPRYTARHSSLAKIKPILAILKHLGAIATLAN